MTSVDYTGDPLQRLECLVPLGEFIRKGAEYGAALAKATSEVTKANALPDRLENIRPSLGVLQNTRHLPVADIVSDLEKLQAAGDALEQCVSTDTLKDAHFSVKEIQEALQRVESQVSKAWIAHVKAEFRPLESLGVVLAEISDTRTTGRNIQKWAKNALGLANTGVPTIDLIREFEKAKSEMPTRLEELGKLGISVAVQTFLLEIANRSATLRHVTPEVLDWLRAKNAHARFRIELL